MATSLSLRQQLHLSVWLFAICLMIVVMVAVGGLTRLTDSGLSITDWQPLHGIIPPLNEAQWQEEFAAYKQFPEYQKINRGMSLYDFKTIFWWEYAHRLWGRLIGLVFAVPFVFFLLRYPVSTALTARLAVLFVLGGLQGVLGWYMVQSGLVDRPDVSHFRLTAHLLAALLLFAACWLQALALWPHPVTLTPRPLPPSADILLVILLPVLLAAIALGGFVAGMDAGLVYNSFPRMGAAWMPSETWELSPWWRNILENPVTMQFCHRLAGMSAWLLTLGLAWAVRNHVPRLALLLAVAATLQVILGISTLLSFVAVVPAALHQLNAVALLAVLLTIAFWRVQHRARYRIGEALPG